MAKKNSASTPRAAWANFTDTVRVKELIALMADNGLTEIELVEDKSRIVLRRGSSSSAAPVGAAAALAAGSLAAAHSTPEPAKLEDDLLTIKSPMVGTFYAAANPDSDAYISIGADVEKDKTIVCVIEAMKVFNEIHADASGTITKILVSNGQTVEYGQALFLVKPG